MRAFLAVFGVGFAAVASSPSAPASPPTGAPLPAVDARCASDADCGVTLVALEGDERCCYACGQSTAGNRAWLASLDRACRQVLADEKRTCAGRRCRSGPTRATCERGSCVVVTK